MLLESVRGVGPRKKVDHDGWTYYTPGALTPEQVERLIPKDCLIYNWFWKSEPNQHTSAELNEEYLDKMGFQQVFGNLEPNIDNYETRKKLPTLPGGAPSAWFATNEIGFGKELISTFLGCSGILWSGRTLSGKDLSGRVQSMLPSIRSHLSGITPPSRTETSIVPVDISSQFNMGDTVPALDVNLDGMQTGTVHYNSIRFDLKSINGRRVMLVETTKGTRTLGCQRL